ncbi:MAG TPA: hypothetical protein VFL41_00315 [Gaiellaceae bacterium]|nr:hypothetical protein [Gaiellaceae bacterium]
MRGLVVAGAALVLAGSAAAAATTPTRPVYDAHGRLVQTPFAPPRQAQLTEQRATAIFLRNRKVADWLERYPTEGRTTDATYDAKRLDWSVSVWDRRAGQIATGRVDDATGVVTEAWTGPQVAWRMARGYPGAFGGRELERPVVWLGFCVIFLAGLLDFRRLRSLRNLDLLVLVSFTVSLWFFNRGDIFTSVPLAFVPLLYLLVRMVWSARAGPARAGAPLWPVWVLAGAAVFLIGFRVGLNLRDSNVIDVGYSGVVGAHRIAHGQMPYGHMPDERGRKCGRPDADGRVRERIQTNGRCESANERGDTYGPVAYEVYVPAYAALGWSGRWDKLPAAHATAIAFDLLTLLGLALVGLRFGGTRLAATLVFAWTAFPFTQYVSNSNTNDAIMPALLVFGFWLVTSPWARGAFVALAGWTKFAALLLVPLWASYEGATRQLSAKVRFAAAFLLASLAAFWILLLEPDPLHAARVFWDRTLGWQVGRDSPFSIWGWGQYHADGIPDLGWLQTIAIVLLVVGSVAVYFVPRRKTAFQLAALTAAVLIGFELTLTHWFYLYIPWFLPFVAFALLAPADEAESGEASPTRDRPARELVAAG